MFKVNDNECMFRESNDFSNDAASSWDSQLFFDNKEHPLVGGELKEEACTGGFNSTKFDGSNTKSDFSNFGDELKPLVVETKSNHADIMDSLDLFRLKNIVNNKETDLNSFLDDYVFDDLECENKINVLPEVQVAANKKKIRKSPAQVRILKSAYEVNDEWSKDLIEDISQQTGLSFKQVYKWYASERSAHQKRLPKLKRSD